MKKTLILALLTLSLFFSIDTISASATPIQTDHPNVASSTRHTKPNIALIVNSDAISQLHEKTPKAIRNLFKEKFPESQYTLTEDKQLYQALLTSMEDEKIFDISMVNREILSSLGKKYGYDYVLLLVYKYGSSDYSSSVWSSTYKAAVILQAKVVDVDTKEYLYRQDVSVTGKSTDAFGDPSFQSAVNKSMINTTKKFCEEVKIETVSTPR